MVSNGTQIYAKNTHTHPLTHTHIQTEGRGERAVCAKCNM